MPVPRAPVCALRAAASVVAAFIWALHAGEAGPQLQNHAQHLIYRRERSAIVPASRRLPASPNQSPATSIGSFAMQRLKTSRRDFVATPVAGDLSRSLMCGGIARADDEGVMFTPPGFHQPGQAIPQTASEPGSTEGHRARRGPGEPTFCRVTVVGSDGNFYFPKQNYLTPYALTGRWPKTGLGNREGKRRSGTWVGSSTLGGTSRSKCRRDP